MKTNKIEKILLIQPPAFTNIYKTDINPNIPLGIAYIAAVLEKEGYTVKILDAFVEGWKNEEPIDENIIRVGLSFDEIERKIRDFSPDIVGISSLFTAQRKNAHSIGKIVKNINKDIIVIMGGAHPTVLPEKVLEDSSVDFVVIGEGECTTLEILKCLEKGNDFHSLDGVGFKENGKIIILPKTKFIENLDSLPFPAHHLLPMAMYSATGVSHGGFLKRTPYSSIITSRGCPFRCTFCSANRVFGHKYRYRSIDNVMKEIDMLVKTYRIRELIFEDDNLTLNPKRAEEFFNRLIEKKYDLIWDTPNGVAAYTLSEDILKKMKQSGCVQLNLAIESGNQWVLDNLIKKPLKLEKIIPIINYARKLGLNVNAFFVVGMPGESLEQIKDTFRFARRMKFYFPHFSVLTPYPGSEVYEICKEKDYLVANFDLDRLKITEYNVQTPQWTIKDLNRLLKMESIILRIHYFLENPAHFFSDYALNILRNPINYIKKLFEIAKYNICGN